jgi:hypothetical protein
VPLDASGQCGSSADKATLIDTHVWLDVPVPRRDATHDGRDRYAANVNPAAPVLDAHPSKPEAARPSPFGTSARARSYR